MKLEKIEVKNFRMLRDFSIKLENNLSLVIGKNNTGKTSLLLIMNKFLNLASGSDTSRPFNFDDFNIDYRKELIEILTQERIPEDEFKERFIRMRIWIKYSKSDDFDTISLVMQNLDVNNYYVVLSFDYVLDYTRYDLMMKAYQEFKNEEKKKKGALANIRVV